VKRKNISRNRAHNPVANALVKAQLKKEMLNMRIHLLMMDDKAFCKEEVLSISDTIHIIAACYEMMGQIESREFRMLRSAMNILMECSESGFIWKREWAITIDNAIGICSEHWNKIPSKIFAGAVTQLREVRMALA
jgi:hypothetical protein